jgi:hypothetical protein
VRLKGLSQLKNPMTSSGIEPATLRLVALCLNQLRYRVPPPTSRFNELRDDAVEIPNDIAGVQPLLCNSVMQLVKQVLAAKKYKQQ